MMRPFFIATALLLAAVAEAQVVSFTPDLQAPVKNFGRVGFDARSLLIDGKRVVIWSSEMHAFRLPSPDLWRDILQKMKASGFNTVAVYFVWGYHSPKRGVYDFTGIRDIERLLAMAAEEGLYVITRAGPYVNAELTRGGFPGWLVNQRARARTDDPEYLAAADEWLTQVHAIIARHQINGGGTVILHQIENELALTTPAQSRYMDHLYAKARADGITVPIFHNDQGRNGYWVPRGSGVEKTVEGPVDLYAFDGYPGGTCTVTGVPTRDSPAPDWGFYGVGGARGGASASPRTPGFAAEFGGGWFDYWGSNGGYECNALQRGNRYQRVFYGTNLANGISIQSFYMGFGGTSWGWTPGPVVFTSYDYGAAISEIRELRPKAEELRQLGGLIAAVPDLAGMLPAEPVTVSSANVQVYHNRNPDTDARFLLVTHKPSNRQTDERFEIGIDLPEGRYTLPQMRLNGFDAKWLVAGVNLGGQRLVWSTSELQTHIVRDADDVLLLYGGSGDAGATTLRYASPPKVSVLAGAVETSFEDSSGDLILNYKHGSLARVQISGGGRKPLTLLIGDHREASRFWRTPTNAHEAVLIRGPALVRSAQVRRGVLALKGDTRDRSSLEIWAPASVRKVTWNDAPVAVQAGMGSTLVARSALPGPAAFPVPDLLHWRMAPGTPEADVSFDDSGWQAVDHRVYSSITARPDGQPNLLMDAYGFHEGDVWYRGRFSGSAEAQRIHVYYGGGGAGMVQVFVDGQWVGQHELPAGLPRPITTGAISFNLPAVARDPGAHVVSIMVRNNGHNWDLDADDFHKEARGLVSASIESLAGPSFEVPVEWKIQGRAGGEEFADAARGVPNNGGQYGERMGWHLPAFDDGAWQSVTVPAAQASAGTTWYRTHFRLAVPAGHDATIGIAFGDTNKPRSAASYRALIFVNGWNMGQFIAHVGPQRLFPIPEGILDHRGSNVVALAVTSDGMPGNALEEVRLVVTRAVRGGLPVGRVSAPTKLPGEESTNRQ